MSREFTVNRIAFALILLSPLVAHSQAAPIPLGEPLRCLRVLTAQACAQPGDVTFVATIAHDSMVGLKIRPPMDTPERSLVGDCMMGNQDYYTKWFQRGRDLGHGEFSVTVTPRPEICE